MSIPETSTTDRVTQHFARIARQNSLYVIGTKLKRIALKPIAAHNAEELSRDASRKRLVIGVAND